MIDPEKIPTFTGNLETLETHATSLKTTASDIRTTGKEVHEAFQTLDPVYDAPEQEELLDSTIPVRDKADAFAKKLESVSGALAGFATAARPLVKKMNQLREDAEKFVADNKDDDDWQQDQGKIDENARLVHEVGTTWVAFQGAERDAANKITALVGGTHFTVDDGSHKAGMYGFREGAGDTPWGTVDEREYTGLRAAWEWTKDNVGGALKGFFVDGVWGTIKGLGSMVNVFDWDNFKKTWSGIGDVFGGISAYLMTPYDWAMDKMFGPVDHSDTDKQKAALRNFGKSLVAWDEWGKDPARAFGTVLFNGVTLGSGSLLKLGKAGKLGVGAEAAVTALGKAGALADPMSYLGKAAGVTKLKVGDLMESLRTSRAGVDDMVPTLPHSPDLPTTPGHPYVDSAGNTRVIDADGHIRDEHGNVVPDTDPVREPHKDDLPNHQEPAPQREKVHAGVGGGPGRVENSVNHPPGGPHPPGGHVTEHPAGSGGGTGDGGGGSHTPSGGGGHGGTGHGGGHGPAGHGNGPETPGGTGTPGGDGAGAPPGDGPYSPRPGEEVPDLRRQDNDFSEQYNNKGQRKSYLNEDGDLVPANPDGQATIVDHVVGREPRKSDSPFTSTSKDGADAKDYGGKTIRVDLTRLMKDIADGKVEGVEVYSPREVEAAIQASAEKTAGRPIDISVPPRTSYEKIREIAEGFGLGKKKTASIEQRMKDMMHTRRDSEWLVKGIVPKEYITGPF
ncbi:hypothetical protein [Streptomyces sp. ITFR-16]|uniref:hypothetical protein n=1 Tax=Streptomyces sp. ITFR-16 TaxID=3075198 RepID=UPI0028892377|nr:hypothetical protein [Streptomyces sp. ITFR-16]WNI21732.1 hypothetical protein RLT58_07205 [Streptomyces sp. ITFR-16]